MKSVHFSQLLIRCALLLSTVLLGSSCSEKPPGSTSPPSNQSSSASPSPASTPSTSPANITEAVCSTLDKVKTAHCTLETDEKTGVSTLNYTLTASMRSVNIVVENNQQPALTVRDALVYNNSLLPERLVVKRGDELRIQFTNSLPAMPCSPTIKDPCIPQRFSEIGKDQGMTPVATNLHTHGLITPWDFKNGTARGDNILTVMFNPKPAQNLPANASDRDMCTAAGNQGNFRYPILPTHDIGLNWYHPHAHGVVGYQVEGGMAGLLMIADAEADKYLTPIYLQLKDMQVSKVTDADAQTYQFEKFEPAVASACHTQGREGDWVFDNNTPGRCNYHQVDANNKTLGDYAWLFLVNGQLFPHIPVANSAYFRVANSSANVTYRLMLEPEAVQSQTQPQATYYTPAFRVVEKDGMTTTEQAAEGKENLCTLTMTTATRVGFGLELEDMSKNQLVCKLTVTVSNANGKKTTQYQIEPIKTADLPADAKAQIGNGKAPTAYNLVQQGINTGEDDWPAVKLAKFIRSEKEPASNLVTYLQTVAKNNASLQNTSVAARPDIKEPTDKCQASIPPVDADGINRHLVLFFGTDTDGEHFGLVANGELNEGKPVTRDTIKAWRTEYQKQFAGSAQPNAFVEYESPTLAANALQGLVTHKFGYDANGNIITNICTKLGTKPEHWRIHNLSAQIHNFHLHQNKFKVLAVRGAACTPKNPFTDKPYQAFSKVDATSGYLPASTSTADLKDVLDEQCVKTYAEVFHDVPASFQLVEPSAFAAPAAPSRGERRAVPPPAVDYGMHDTFPVPPMGYIDLEVAFNKPEQVGEYVFHCHILEHEDAGMMGKIVVKSR